MGLTGLGFGPAWDRSVAITYDGLPIRILSLADLIHNKRCLDRPQDRLDVQMLEAALRRG